MSTLNKNSQKTTSIDVVKIVKKNQPKTNISIFDPIRSRMFFKKLRQDVQPLYGLQDWTTKEWKVAFATNHGKELCLLLSVRNYQEFIEKMKNGLLLSEWVNVLKFQNKFINGKFETIANHLYLHDSVLLNSIHRQLFPMGVFKEQDWEFAVKNSSFYSVQHRLNNRAMNIFMLILMSITGIGVIVYIIYICRLPFWSMENTVQSPDTTTLDIITRTKERGTLASLLGGFTFSLFVNASIDYFAKIDPSTSTALIGIFLGNTWGFVLDNMLGSDEGFREYLWNTWEGMKYGLGSLYTTKFIRYIITLLFDMFFTVILFKQFYPLLVRTAGFSINGNEWIANSFVSTIITLLTYQVYANMTRFQWAYPSGEETIFNQWISGPTMLLVTVVMNMVYLTSETRTQQGEPGINHPNIKSIVTMFTFIILILLQGSNSLDPTEIRETFVDISTSSPLYKVCEVKGKWVNGLIVYIIVSSLCIGSVIFGTSNLNMFSKLKYSSLITNFILFSIFMLINFIVIVFFSIVPFFKESQTRENNYDC